MTAANAFSQRPQRGPFSDEPADSWSMPLVRIGGTQIHVAYSIFVALAVLTAFTATVTPREGNADLPLVTLIGFCFWATCWIVQTVAALAICSWMRCPRASLTIGLWGVEANREPWTASQCLVMVAVTLMPVLLLGTAIMTVDYVWFGQSRINSNASGTDWISGWMNVWSAPSLGLTHADSILQTGAWLCFIQFLCQSLPFPTTLGRLGLIATVCLVQRETDPKSQIRHARFGIRVIAIALTLSAAMILMMDHTALPVQWPLLLLLGLVMWFAARARDISGYVYGFHELSDEQILQWLDSDEPDMGAGFGSVHRPSTENVFSRVAGFARNWNHRRKALRALEREHAEADDIKQLDEVLQRLHEEGHDALSERDRALLMRVSKTLQKHRAESSESA